MNETIKVFFMTNKNICRAYKFVSSKVKPKIRRKETKFGSFSAAYYRKRQFHVCVRDAVCH